MPGLRDWPLARVRWWVAVLPLAIPLVVEADVPRITEIAVAVVATVLFAGLPWLLPALLSRGALWFSFVTMALIALTEARAGSELMVGFLPVAWALVLLGRPEAQAQQSRFAPVAFRGTLMLAMMLGCADAFWLGTAALVGTARGRLDLPWIALMGAGSLLVLAGVWGASRLKVWGVLLGVACNLAIIAVVCQQVSQDRARDAWVGGVLLAGGAALHTLLQIPLLVAIVRGRPPAWAQHDFRWVGSGAVVLLTLAVLVRVFVL